MLRYIVSLVLFFALMAVVLIGWTPAAKSKRIVEVKSECEIYCESQFICGCATKLFGFIRLTECELQGEAICNQVDSTATCTCPVETPLADCKDNKEIPLVWVNANPNTFTCTPIPSPLATP
jgi:hypothetical protein